MQPLSNKTTPLWDDSKEEYASLKRSNRQQAKKHIEGEIMNYKNEVTAYSEQKPTVEIEPEYIETSELSPHVIVVEHDINDDFKREVGDEK